MPDAPSGHIGELASNHALGFASAEEQALVRQHVASCEDCARLLAEHHVTVAALRETPGLAPPNPELWSRIEAAIAEPAASPATPSQKSRLRWLAAAAALVTAFALGAGSTWLLSREDDDGRPAALLDRPTDDLVFTLASLGDSPARGRIFMSSDRRDGVVAVSGLAQPARDQSYAVWLLLEDQTRIQVGTFNVDSAGTGIAPLTLPSLPYDWRDSGRYLALTVSLIDLATPMTPSGQPLLVGPLY